MHKYNLKILSWQFLSPLGGQGIRKGRIRELIKGLAS